MNQDIQYIIDYLATQRAGVFSNFDKTITDRIISDRIVSINCEDSREYLQCLKENSGELQALLDELTINVSKFFRNPFVFELVRKKILQPMIFQKSKANESLRIWSAGCAQGEEAYSLAIIIRKLLVKSPCSMSSHIFASDFDEEALVKAKSGKYHFEDIENVKAGLLRTYFTERAEMYQLQPVIKDMINFSAYDLLDTKTIVPPGSIFGNFDLVFCRNVLIYYQKKEQTSIFNKLDNSLAQNGFLILGEAETLPEFMKNKYIQIHDCVFQKMR